MPVHEVAGNRLEYERYGSGRAVVLHHGLVGGATVPAEWEALAVGVGIDLISIARPGYGRSDPVPMAAIAEWSPLLAGLLDALDVGEFDVLGVSAGAPYSYAVASMLPERVGGVAVLSGLGLVNEPDTRRLYPQESQQAFESFATGTDEQVRQFWQVQLGQALEELPDDHPGEARWPLRSPTMRQVRGGRRSSSNDPGDSSPGRSRRPSHSGTPATTKTYLSALPRSSLSASRPRRYTSRTKQGTSRAPPVRRRRSSFFSKAEHTGYRMRSRPSSALRSTGAGWSVLGQIDVLFRIGRRVRSVYGRRRPQDGWFVVGLVAVPHDLDPYRVPLA
jgi:pimeloyl-ACP methyl ester carboxylesterase